MVDPTDKHAFGKALDRYMEPKEYDIVCMDCHCAYESPVPECVEEEQCTCHEEARIEQEIHEEKVRQNALARQMEACKRDKEDGATE